MIRLEHVSRLFGSVVAVDNVDMEVPAGAVCVLLGPSGCGKTTTMKMINRLIAPTSGKIFIDGRDTSKIEVIQDGFMKLQAELNKTVVFVSHDIDEAVKMASRIAIFREGRLVQYDTPDNILAHPLNAFIAEFVGSDRTLKRLRLIKVA